jgi:hypothetical protein
MVVNNNTTKEEDLDKRMDKHIERLKRMEEIEAMNSAISSPPPKPPSLTDMFGGPAITSQLAPILSGVSKMIASMPVKTKLEGNINGGNFSIEVVDITTCHLAIDFLNQIMKNFEENPPPVTQLARERRKLKKNKA